MLFRYQEHCLADPIFYDRLDRAAGFTHDFAVGAETPDGWMRQEKGPWTMLAPLTAALPTQGWKVHVSARLDNAVTILATVREYCVAHRTPFKFLSSRAQLFARNAKYGDRSSSGKFITIYPADEAELERIVSDLDDALGGLPGPYVLTDVRIGDGPLYARYGGFAERYCRVESGDMVPAIEDPDGHLVPDERRPVFTVPPWVRVPEVLAPHVSARLDGDEPTDFPFRVKRSLHFSNGGGVYVAEDTRSGDEIVLREARPHAGYDTGGQDAVDRLRREKSILEKLSGQPFVPRFFGHVTCWEHHFLAMEYIPGLTFAKETVTRFPLIRASCTDAEVAEYTGWALDVLDRIDEALTALHACGVVFNDLHPHNVIVRPDGSVAFVDFEVSAAVDDDFECSVGAPGFVPPDRRRGAARDRYALGCLRLTAFFPLTSLLALDPSKAEVLVDAIRRRFPVPDSFGDAVLRDLDLARAAGPANGGLADQRVARLAARLDEGDLDWPALRASVGTAILAGATPDRQDRLFPGDIEQFTYNGVGLAYGAAGVLHALATTGHGRFPDHERWLVAAVQRGAHNERTGFYDGLHGVAYVLHQLGRVDDALAVLDEARRAPLDAMSPALLDGLPGVGLNLLHFAAATGDSTFRVEALAVADRLADVVRSVQPAQAGTGAVRAGLMHGASGSALFFLRLFEETGDGQLLDLAVDMLRRDLDACIAADDGSLQVNQGWRMLPYLETGSVGIGLVLQQLLAHRPDEEFTTALNGITAAAQAEFVIGCGLFNGRAGLLAFLARQREADPAAASRLQPVIDRHIQRMSWHMLSYRGGVAFPGDQLLRLSMDLATGSAGVLSAVHAAVEGTTPVLPFLGMPAADVPEAVPARTTGSL